MLCDIIICLTPAELGQILLALSFSSYLTSLAICIYVNSVS